MIKQNKSEWTKEEKDKAENDGKYMAGEIKRLEGHKRELENNTTTLTAPVNEAKALLKKEEEAFPKKDRWVRAQIEHQFLRPYGVDKAAHHGGDVTGGGIKRLMANAKPLCEELKVFLDGIATIDKLSKEKYGSSFEKITAAQRTELLTALDKEQKEYQEKKEEDAPSHYFRMMKELTLLGFFTSEVGATKALRYVAVPTKFEGCVDYKKGDRAWAT
jgi:hypothetical protein